MGRRTQHARPGESGAAGNKWTDTVDGAIISHARNPRAIPVYTAVLDGDVWRCPELAHAKIHLTGKQVLRLARRVGVKVRFVGGRQ